jgi:hypothetical protein
MQPTIVSPNAPLPGMQATGFHQKFRVGTCEEADCEWFLNGREGIDEGGRFVHPAGVQCGDTTRCQPCKSPRYSGALCGVCEPCKSGTANCPCPQRVTARSMTTGRRGHMVPDFQIIPVLSYTEPFKSPRAVGTDEWLTRLHEGTDRLTFIRTRGL